VIISYSKSNPSAFTPIRANPSDAGIDIFACIANDITVYPCENTVIPTGIKIEIPHGFMLQVMNRSSIASKLGLIIGAHVIDAGYEGEIFINLHNTSDTPRVIEHGDKIAQLVMMPVVHFRLNEEDEDDLYFEDIVISERESGGFGSTDA
jgi:dUTP pyrophosphatase